MEVNTIKLVSSKLGKSAPIHAVNNRNSEETAPKRKASREVSGSGKTRRARKGGVAAIIIAAITAAAVCGAFAYAGYYAVSSNDIFPNVSAYGVDVSRMTKSAAADALRRSDALQAYRDKAVTIYFPGDQRLEISAEESGLTTDVNALAEELYALGRGTSFVSTGKVNFIEGAIGYIRHLLNLSSGDLTNALSVDRDIVMPIVEAKADAVNSELSDNVITVDDDKVTVIKGASGMSADAETIYALIETAFQTRNFEPIEYTPQTTEPREITVDEIKAMVRRDPVNAEFDAEFNVSESMNGVTFDEDTARDALANAGFGDTVVIPLVTIPPERATEDLEAMLFRDILSEHSTDLTASKTRSMNVQLAAEAINGLVLMPGGIFDYNEVVGQRTVEKGYGEAPAYVNGDTTLEIGGGICQVSSTIYYCTLLANLEIVERHYHTFQVTYLPPGMDATVSWNGPNFRFANSTEYPMKIETYRDGQKLFVKLLGTKIDDTYVQMTYNVLETLPYQSEYRADDTLEPGTTKLKERGTTGLRVRTYRTVYAADGSEISKKEEAVSRYKGHTQITLVPTAELDAYLNGTGGTPAVTEDDNAPAVDHESSDIPTSEPSVAEPSPKPEPEPEPSTAGLWSEPIDDEPDPEPTPNQDSQRPEWLR